MCFLYVRASLTREMKHHQNRSPLSHLATPEPRLLWPWQREYYAFLFCLFLYTRCHHALAATEVLEIAGAIATTHTAANAVLALIWE